MIVPKNIINLAEFISSKSNMKQQMSAIIFKNDRVLAQGYNHRLSTANFPRNHIHGVPVYSIHAEVQAIRWCHRKYGTSIFSGAQIYVHRRGNKMSKPCSHCMQIIELFGLTPSWSPI